MHHNLGSMTLSQLAFPRDSKLNIPWEKSQWDNTIVKKNREKKKGSATLSATREFFHMYTCMFFSTWDLKALFAKFALD